MPTTGRSTRAALAAAALTLSAWMTACSSSAPPHPSPTASRTASATPAPTPTPVPTSTPTPALTASWPVYHQNPERTGQSADTPAVTTLATEWNAALDVAVWAQPIVVGGDVIVATENDTLYSLNPASGSVLWKTHVGTPVPRADLPCGNIFPLGMTGTPAYDPATQSIFVVAEETGPVHVLYDFDAVTGAVLWSRDVDISSSLEHPAAVQQRPALTVANGYVYIGFGGLDGDCSQYVGAVVAVPTSNQGASLDFMVPTSREGAVWATGGPVLGPGGDIFVATGNGAAEGGTWDESDSVLELSPTLQVVSDWAPSRWAYDNAHDLDLGSVAPTLLPDGYIFIAGKSGIGYVLHESALGGVGGEVYSHQVCAGAMSFGGTSFSDDTLYQPCANGVEAISVASDGSFSIVWQTSSGANGPPVLGGGSVFSVDTNSGTLCVLNAASGATQAQISVGSVPDFASPTLLGDVALVGTRSGVVAISGA
ncbi:MAG: PQQ-binding-like beta-propeller repeat protein [Candidatus Dormibacteria bacterium]